MAFDLITKKRTGRDWSISVSGEGKSGTEKTRENGIFVTILGVVGLAYSSMDKPSRSLQAVSAATTAAGLYMWTRKA
jgi:hypothetical protein